MSNKFLGYHIQVGAAGKEKIFSDISQLVMHLSTLKKIPYMRVKKIFTDNLTKQEDTSSLDNAFTEARADPDEKSPLEGGKVKAEPKKVTPPVSKDGGVEGLTIYTDGSHDRKTKTTGWAMVGVEKDQKIFERGGNLVDSTNNAAELTAIIDALKYVSTEREKKDAINGGATIFSDSEYCVNSLTKWMSGWKKNGWKKRDGGELANLELMKQADELLTKLGKQVTIKHVLAHNGNVWNEEADRLANIYRKADK